MNTFKILAHSGLSRIIHRRLMEEIKYIDKATRLLSTVNPKDYTYDALAKSWWDVNGIMIPLHKLNPLRVQLVREGLANTGFVIQKASSPLQGVKIADVGCGAGILTENLARAGAHVTGIDASTELINVAKEHLQLEPDIAERVNYVNTTIEEFSQQNKELYDVVIASEVLEHVENSNFFLKECIKIVKPRGSIFITTPNKTLYSWLGCIIVAEYILNFIPRGMHDWNKFIPPHEVQHWLDNYGCRTISIQGYMYDPILKRCFWSSCSKFCYTLHAIKLKKGA